MRQIQGNVFNIQRFSIHDGPGIRTTVFLSGCPLRCFWCHNPEGLELKPRIMFYPERCILCGDCTQVCPNQAHQIIDLVHVFDRSLCSHCGKCAEGCFAGALQMSSQPMTLAQVMREILADRSFYEASDGGVTISGGEPLLQLDFTLSILHECRKNKIPTAVETTAHGPWKNLETTLLFTDLVMMDIKHLDPVKHKAATGVSNEKILANARLLALTGKPITFRIPIIPNYNDTAADVTAIARFVQEITSENNGSRSRSSHYRLELLPFHRLAGDKYQGLGLEYRANHLESPSKEKMKELVKAARTIFENTYTP